MRADPQSFEEWYPTVHPRLVTSLAAVFGDAEIAADAADEALVRAYERWSRVAKMASPGGWTYRTALNVGRRRMRRRGMERRLTSRERITTIPGPTGEIWTLVADLPERQRIAVVLRHVGHLSESDVGEAMGIARGTVSATLRDAYGNLRSSLADAYPELEAPS